MEKISLVSDIIDKEDIDYLIEWLKTNPRLTKGEQTVLFENEWSELLGVKYSLFCNSGSSANLLMLYALIAGKRLKNKKIVVPALCWATDMAPVMQLGLEPILCDCNENNLSVDENELEKIFIKENPSALILVSVLGLPPNMDKIISLCEKYNVMLLEDVCESLGSKHKEKNLGTFGIMSSFSLFFGHILSTIEGGMVCTDDEEIYEILKSIRSHGWDRDASSDWKNMWKNKWNINDFNSLYTFYYAGFNLRSTDLQAYIGKKQLKKLENVSKIREENFRKYQELIQSEWKPNVPENCFVSNFAYPIIHPKRDIIVQALNESNIENRPLICGSMGKQPFFVEKYGEIDLAVANKIDKYGMYIPNHPELTEEQIIYISNIINDVIK